MTQEGRVEEFWTTMRRNRPDEDNVRPLLKALAAARRSIDEDHPAEETRVDDAVVVDIRPDARFQPWSDGAIEFVPEQPTDQTAAEAARVANVAVAAESVGAVARAVAARTNSPGWIMVEPSADASPPATRSPIVDHPAPQWGDLWRESVQGWVREPDGTKVWRPIVTTTTSVPNWEIDTNLGMVTGESACALSADRLGRLLESQAGADSLRRELAADRHIAQEAMVHEAVARGAHAVIGVNLDYTPLGDCLIVTATGTAVTLRTAR
ncbi:MAG: YbjQ family protein [Acidimicrobiia bacterium]|nr:YbjQ family protein [Acidimicrobiia bacterium]